MATTWAFYADAGLTTPLIGGATLIDGAAAVDRLIYFGSSTASKTLQAASTPGTDPITVSPADSAGGTGAAVGNIKLALTFGGLATATAGAALNVGTTLTSGSANAVPIYVRTLQGALGVGVYDDLTLATNGLVET